MSSRIALAALRREIRDLGDCLLDAGLLIERNYPATWNIGGNRTRLGWRSCVSLTHLEYATLREYVRLLERRQYTFLMFDGSFFQISYDVCGTSLSGHRLAFYPAPISLDPELWTLYQEEGYGLVDLLKDEMESAEFPLNLRLQSPIRFDYDPCSARKDHPSSHLHLSREECRIPVFAPLCVGHFIRFVFRHFYAEQWEEHGFLRNWPSQQFDRTIVDEHRHCLHLECLRV